MTKVIEPSRADATLIDPEEEELDQLFVEHIEKCAPIDDNDRAIDEETFEWVRRLGVDSEA